MGVGVAIAGIVAALVGAGTSIASGVSSNQEMARARKEAKEIAEMEASRRRRERREEMELSQERLGLEKQQVQQQWQTFIENKKRYRDEMNKATLNAVGGSLSRAARSNAEFRNMLLSYRRV